jgi:hypothetical protein
MRRMLWLIQGKISNKTLIGQWSYCFTDIAHYITFFRNSKLQGELQVQVTKEIKQRTFIIVAIVNTNLEWLDPWTPDKLFQIVITSKTKQKYRNIWSCCCCVFLKIMFVLYKTWWRETLICVSVCLCGHKTICC